MFAQVSDRDPADADGAGRSRARNMLLRRRLCGFYSGRMPRTGVATSTSGWATVGALGVFWGLSVAAARVSLAAGISPVVFAVCETVLVSVVCALVLTVRRIRVTIDSARRRLWLVNGTLVVIIPYLVSYTALTHLTAGEVTVVLSLAPVLTALLAMVLGMERWTVRRLAGGLIALTGVVIVAATATGATIGASESAISHTGWVAIAMLSPLCYAIANVYVVSRPARTVSNPIANVLGSNLVGVVGLGTLLLGMSVAGAGQAASVDMGVAVPYLLLAAGANLAANLLFFIAARRTRASILALSGYLTTLFGIIFGILLAGESWSWTLVTGAALILIGVAFSGRSEPRTDTSDKPMW